jgi:hypothetical protein
MEVAGRPSTASDDCEYLPPIAGYAAALPHIPIRRGVPRSGGGGDSDFEYEGSDSDYSDDSTSAAGARRRRKAAPSMGIRKPSSGGAGGTRVLHRWTAEEHARLESLVRQYGTERNWALIAEGISGRSGKQCRERWLNHMRDGIIKWVAGPLPSFLRLNGLCGT